jgi:hypothetical protein
MSFDPGLDVSKHHTNSQSNACDALVTVAKLFYFYQCAVGMQLASSTLLPVMLTSQPPRATCAAVQRVPMLTC